MGMPYALVLGVLAGVFEMVPMLGPILSALPALAVALFQPWPMVLAVLAFFLLVQQFEAHVLAPRITGHAVGLHPLGAIFALLAGLELGGPVGAVFAVPLAGFLWVVATTLYWRTIGTPEPQSRQGWRLSRRRPQAPPAGPVEPRTVHHPEQG
jgi:predicted PurR-regulated permease PerM